MARLCSPSFIATLVVFLLTMVCSIQARSINRLDLGLWSRNRRPMDLSNFHVPLSNGSASLPPPTAGLTLKAVTLGRGTQNYTCAAGSTAAPVAVGAKADLLDVSPFLPPFPSAEAQSVLNLLSQYLLFLDLAVIQKASIPCLGKHIFDSAGVPTFDLRNKGILKAKKISNIAAPKTASTGARGTRDGTIDWLMLGEAPGSVGLKQVYRVETAGGKAPASCGGGPARKIEVQYAAQYWFFG